LKPPSKERIIITKEEFAKELSTILAKKYGAVAKGILIFARKSSFFAYWENYVLVF
jgi:hypothetical protein